MRQADTRSEIATWLAIDAGQGADFQIAWTLADNTAATLTAAQLI